MYTGAAQVDVYNCGGKRHNDVTYYSFLKVYILTYITLVKQIK